MRVTCSSVDFHYDSQPVLRDISLDIPNGSFTLLCGQTGSGKSTLLQVISGLERPDKGEIHYSMPEPRRFIAIVFQLPETQLFAKTVQRDIEYGLELKGISKQERTGKAREALRRVGLNPAAFGDRSPFLLSAGEKRRVAIAGALALEPQVLLLDEPTAGLDPAAVKDLLEVLVRLHADGLTLVVSTHDLDSFFSLADQAIILHKGQVHYRGNVRELAANPAVLQEAGLEPPAAIRLALRLREKGCLNEIPIRSDELIAALQSKSLNVDQDHDHLAQEKDFGIGDSGMPCQMRNRSDSEPGIPFDWEAAQTDGLFLQRLDPRVKWFGMVLLSFAILKTSHIWGLMVCFVLLAILVKKAEISWRTMKRFLHPFIPMFLFIWFISTVSFSNADVYWGPVGISYPGFVQGGVSMARFLLIMALGVVFTGTTTGAPLREGFEWAIRPLRKVKVPTRDLSLAVSIALQFVPWILIKVNQLQKALASRGQNTIGVRSWTPRNIAFLIVPLLLLVIKMGDDLATAIESRGYNRNAEHVSLYQLNWSRKDTVSAGFLVAFAYLLLWYG